MKGAKALANINSYLNEYRCIKKETGKLKHFREKMQPED